MRLLPLVAATFFMVSGGPYGIEDILDAGYLRALVILVALPFLWSLPTALMIGELASALPEEGGFYVWVRRALGPFWGYQEAWLSLAASIFDMAIYPTLFVLYLGRLFPGWTAGWHGTACELGVIALCCAWNLLGAPAVGDGSIGLFVLLLSPFVVLVVAAFWHGAHLVSHIGWARSGAEGGLSTAILVAMWNYMGWDNASTVAREVDDPRRNYPRAMLWSALVVTVSYVIPLAAMAWAGVSGWVPEHRFVGRCGTDDGGTVAGRCDCRWRNADVRGDVQRADDVLRAVADGAGRRPHASRGIGAQKPPGGAVGGGAGLRGCVGAGVAVQL